MYIKGLFETFKILGKLGIKPKDVIGLGGDVVKMGKSLFNTRVNPKLLQFVEKNGKIPSKILEEIKIHARTLKNASENQKKLFEVNIRDILNAKTPKTPVSSVQKPVTSVKKQATEAFKGWTPRVIKGGKDKLATGGLPKGPAGITSLNGWGSKDKSQNKAGADISASMDKNPNDPGWGGGGGDGPKGPPRIINKPKGPTPEQRRLKQLADQRRQYANFYKKFKGDTKKKTEYLSRLLKNDPLYETYVDKGLLDWSNIKSFDEDPYKTKEEIEKAKQSAWGYTRPWTSDESLYIGDIEKFDPTWTPGWTGDSKTERLNKRIAETIGHEARHQLLGEGEGGPWGWEGQTMWTGDPYSDKVETELTIDENSPYSKYINEGGLEYQGYKPEITSHELLTRMGDFQSYNDPRVYEDIYGNVHGWMPEHLTSDVANKFYDAAEKFTKDTKARTAGEKYENIDPVMVEGLKRAYPDEDVEQHLKDYSPEEIMDILKEEYEYNKEYAKGGIATHFRKK